MARKSQKNGGVSPSSALSSTRRKVTAQQIAEQAGVSRGTVDRVLYHRGGVHPDVQKRVEEIIAASEYRPNRAGKALVMRRPLRLGVMLNAVGNPFFDEVRRGMQEARTAYSDFPVLLEWREARGFDWAAQCRELDELAAAELDGLLITPLNHPAVVERLNALADRNIPVVTVNTDVDGCRRLSYVGCHYVDSGRVAAQMVGLLTHGEGRVLVAMGSASMMGHTQRVQGFQERLAEAFPRMQIVDTVETNDDDRQAAAQVARAMQVHPDTVALYVSAGGVVGCVEAARQAAASRPLQVVTCDLTEDIRRLLDEGQIQATIGQKPYRQGYESMKLLIEKLVFHQLPPPCLYMENEIHVAYKNAPQVVRG